MRHVRAALARIAGIFTKHHADDDLREELQAHLDMEIAEYIRRGMPPAEARRKAMIASGGLTTAAESVRAQRGIPWLEGIAADFMYALRALRNSPAFTCVVIVTLGLGIGADTAIFSVVRGVLLKPLPHRDDDRLVYLRQSAEGPGEANLRFSVPEVRDLRHGLRTVSGLAESNPFDFTLNDGGAARILANVVTGNFFEVMGLSPVLGRLTTSGDDGVAASPVMVLGYDYWRDRFKADSSIIGKSVKVDGSPVTVIGVVQPAPWFPRRVDAIVNMVVSPHHTSATMVEGRTHRMTEIVARLAPGASIEDVKAEVAGVQARMHRDHSEAYGAASNFGIAVIPFREVLGERARLTLQLLMAAAAFVMIISVANVVNLTLMRGVRREQELVLRSALGAGAARLRRLLLVENLVLTLVGAVLGLIIASGGVRLLVSLAERYSPRANEIRLDVVVLGFTFALSVGVAVLLSFAAPLPREGSFASWISTGMRRMGAGASRQRVQHALVIAQVAVSVLLLAGAGLLTRTLQHLAAVETGLRTEEVLTMQVPLLTPTVADAAADATAKVQYERMRRRIRALPGVIEVGVGSNMPLRGSQVRFAIKQEGVPPLTGNDLPSADFRTAGPEYFRASGIPIVEGRPFSASDTARAELVAIINQTLADRLFPGGKAIGKRIAATGDIIRFTPITSDWLTIVGVAGNTQDGGPDAERRGVMFRPFAQVIAIGGGMVIRADSNVANLAAAATAIVREVAPLAPIENVMTIREYREMIVSPRRLNAVLVSSFSVLAVIIAAVGIAGVLAFSVSARTNEIGIRMSLGAASGRVQWMILKEGATLLAIGLALGVVAVLFAARLMRGLLFGVTPHDPATLIGVVLAMAAVGLVACWIPARRAARIDPAIAMRTQ